VWSTLRRRARSDSTKRRLPLSRRASRP
jgi:hypothetical protein